MRLIDRVCAIARLEDVTPHTLRHTFARISGDLGFSEPTIAALLGHSARGVSESYIHFDEALRLAADRIADEMADIIDNGTARPQRRAARENFVHARARLAARLRALTDLAVRAWRSFLGSRPSFGPVEAPMVFAGPMAIDRALTARLAFAVPIPLDWA
ncbi:MAG: hypothetical protein WAK01_10960 [Methylocystis sp.]